MSHSIAISALLRGFTMAGRSVAPMQPGAAPPAADGDWSLLLAAVEQRLRERPELAADHLQALRCLHGLLAAERAAMQCTAQQLQAAQRELAQTRALLATSLAASLLHAVRRGDSAAAR